MHPSSLRRICLLSNYNAYESKRHFTIKLAEAMQRKGIETFQLDIQGIGSEEINKILRFNPQLICSFNTLEPFSDGRQLGDLLEIPLWSIVLDPSYYTKFLMDSPFSIISCIDSQDFLLYKDNSFDRAFLFPHAIEKELVGNSNEKKIYEVVFIGSCYDFEAFRIAWLQKFPKKIDQLILEAAELVLNSFDISVAQAILRACENLKISSEEINFSTIFYYVDYYCRGKDRVELIKSIKNAEIHLFGRPAEGIDVLCSDWNRYLSGIENVKLHPSVSFSESLKILQQSKIVLNSTPSFKYGTHERIFTGLACGALPITNETPFWKREFEEGKEIAFYQPGKWHKVNDTINTYLADEDLRLSVVEKGAHKVLEKHTWDQRVDLLLEILPSMLLENF